MTNTHTDDDTPPQEAQGMDRRLESRLRDLWESRIGGVDPQMEAYEQGYMTALQDTNNLTREQRELWELRFNTCPGHEGYGGLIWCAYCGNLPVVPEEDDE